MEKAPIYYICIDNLAVFYNFLSRSRHTVSYAFQSMLKSINLPIIYS